MESKQERKYSKLAVASFVFGMISAIIIFIVEYGGGPVNRGFLLFAAYIVLPVLSLFLGMASLTSMKKNKLNGMAFALVGIIISVLVLLMILLGIIGIISYLDQL